MINYWFLFAVNNIKQYTLVVDKPDKVLINPMPTVDNGKLTVKEGETIGPYNCLADCNPPCEVKWGYKDTAGKIQDVSTHIKTHWVHRLPQGI